eukprot:sb/3471151/
MNIGGISPAHLLPSYDYSSHVYIFCKRGLEHNNTFARDITKYTRVIQSFVDNAIESPLTTENRMELERDSAPGTSNARNGSPGVLSSPGSPSTPANPSPPAIPSPPTNLSPHATPSTPANPSPPATPSPPTNPSPTAVPSPPTLSLSGTYVPEGIEDILAYNAAAYTATTLRVFNSSLNYSDTHAKSQQ